MSMVFGFFRRVGRATCSAVLGAAVLAGCARLSALGFDAHGAIGSVSDADRCADILRRAFPDSGAELADPHVSQAGTALVIQVTGIRKAVPANTAYARRIGVECRFDGGILTGFRWTEGPLRANAAPAP
jgi:hypothetical protein